MIEPIIRRSPALEALRNLWEETAFYERWAGVPHATHQGVVTVLCEREQRFIAARAQAQRVLEGAP